MYSPLPFDILAAILFSMTVPIGLPPADHDPALDRMVPDRVLVFMSSNGATTPKLDSPNQTEQFLAEPEIQRFAAQFDKSMRKLAEERVPNQGLVEARWWGRRAFPTLLKLLVTRPFVAYGSEVDWTTNDPTLQGGCVFKLGSMKGEAETLLKTIVDGLPVTTIEGQRYHRVRIDASQLLFGVHDDLLIIATSSSEVRAILGRRKHPAPKWIGELRSRFKIQRPATFAKVDIAEIVEEVRSVAGEAEAFDPILRVGVQNLDQWVSATGLDGTGSVRFAALDLKGEPQGLLSALGAKPLTNKDLAPIPVDATVGVAVRWNLTTALNAVIESVGDVAAQPVEDGLEAVERMIGMRVREGFLASLGDVWTIHTSPADGGFIAGWTATVQVKDQGKVQLGLAFHRLREIARRSAQGRDVAAQSSQFEGVDIFTIPTSNYGWMDFSYCVTETHLVVAPFPQAIKSYLSSRTPKSKRVKLGEHPKVAKLAEKASMVGILDYPRTLEDLYPFAQLIVSQGFLQFGKQQGDFNKIDFPSLRCISRHADDGILSMTRTKRGLQFEQRQQLPVASIGPVATIMAIMEMAF